MTIGLSETFPLELSIVARVLRSHEENPKLSKAELSQQVGLNERKINGVSGWLRHMGLWDVRNGISELGKILLQHDKYFRLTSTKWLLHHSLAANPGAEVWYFGFNHYFSSGLQFNRDEFTNQLRKASVGITKAGTESKHLTSDVGILLNSYTKNEDAFVDLGLMNFSGNTYMAHSGEISALLIAYAMYSWKLRSGVTTTAIDTLLSAEANVGRLFLLSRKELLNKLRELETMGLVRVTQTADLDNVTYTFNGSAYEILDRHFNEIKG